MSEIAKTYINKAIYIYDKSVVEWQKIAKEKNHSFAELKNFSEFIVRNAGIINQFKSIPDNVCKMIDSRNFDIRKITLKFDQIKEVYGIISNIEFNLNRLPQKHQNEFEVTEKLIIECFNNLTFSTISDYKTKFENANRQLLDFIEKIKTVDNLISQIKTKIIEIKYEFPTTQVEEFEKLIKDFDNDVTFSTIDNYKTKLEDANNQLRKMQVAEEQRKKEERRKQEEERRKQEPRYQSSIEELEQLNKWGLRKTGDFKKLADAYKNLSFKFMSFEEYFEVTDLINQCEKKIVECNRQSQGLCRHCGGEFKGFFSKTCKSCGKGKDC